MNKRLGVWNGRNLSIGGRVTLINSVLSSLPLYFFSFFKAPVCVLKELVGIQRKFLWGGGTESKKVCWISWERVCQPKDKGGLGLNNLELFNHSLLYKWKWRCLNDINAPCCELLKFWYGSFNDNFVLGQGKERLKTSSLWWHDLWSLGGEDNGGWFGSNVRSVLDDGNNISFWKEKWLGMVPLCVSYPTLFEASSQRESVVAAMGVWEHNDWSWRLSWRSDLSAMDEVLTHDLIPLLNQIRSCRVIEDRRKWLVSSTCVFSANSAYVGLLNRAEMDSLGESKVIALKRMWKNNVPSKISSFGWRLLLEKLWTREALFRKGIITNIIERCYVLCFNLEESLDHLFLNCHFSATLWKHVLNWMDVGDFITGSMQEHFIHFGNIIKDKVHKRCRHIIWLATTWSLWRMRNNILFQGG
jgi:hypothetical protein